MNKVIELMIKKEITLMSGGVTTIVSTSLFHKIESALEDFNLLKRLDGYDFDIKKSIFTKEDLTRIGYGGVISYVEPPLHYYGVGNNNKGNKIKANIEEKEIK